MIVSNGAVQQEVGIEAAADVTFRCDMEALVFLVYDRLVPGQDPASVTPLPIGNFWRR
jgi:hypothetical protein